MTTIKLAASGTYYIVKRANDIQVGEMLLETRAIILNVNDSKRGHSRLTTSNPSLNWSNQTTNYSHRVAVFGPIELPEMQVARHVNWNVH
jgi:hypothetical protein